MVYRNQLLKRSELDEKRVEFVRELVALHMSEEPYMYLDESALHGFM